MTCMQGLRRTLSLLLFILVLGFSGCSTSSPPSSADSCERTPSKYKTDYDTSFMSSSARFLPQYDWLHLKSQCYQESRLDPRANSPVGASGLCQFMPGTWKEVSERLNLNTSPYNAKANILAAAYYMGTLDKQWSSPRPPLERLTLARASYNAGLGNLLKAQKSCNGALLWREIEGCLNYPETSTYIRRIDRYYADMSSEGIVCH
jgi:hypothetical protein